MSDRSPPVTYLPSPLEQYEPPPPYSPTAEDNVWGPVTQPCVPTDSLPNYESDVESEGDLQLPISQQTCDVPSHADQRRHFRSNEKQEAGFGETCCCRKRPNRKHTTLCIVLFIGLAAAVALATFLTYYALFGDERGGNNSPPTRLRVATILQAPYLLPNPPAGATKESGFIPDLMDEVAPLAGFEYAITPASSKVFGAQQPDGTWIGLIAELMNGNADVIAAPLFPTAQREQVAAFTVPFLDVEASILVRKSVLGSNWINSSRSLDELLSRRNMTFGILKHGVFTHSFNETAPFSSTPAFQNLAFLPYNTEGVELVRMSNFGFVMPRPVGDFISSFPPCDLVTVGAVPVGMGYSLAVARDSDILYGLNHALSVLKNSGKLDELYRKWWFDRSACFRRRRQKMT